MQRQRRRTRTRRHSRVAQPRQHRDQQHPESPTLPAVDQEPLLDASSLFYASIGLFYASIGD